MFVTEICSVVDAKYVMIEDKNKNKKLIDADTSVSLLNVRQVNGFRARRLGSFEL